MRHPPGTRYQPEPRDGYGGSLPQPQDREYIDRISYQEACNTYDQDMHEDRVRDKEMQLNLVVGTLPLTGMGGIGRWLSEGGISAKIAGAVMGLFGASTTIFSGDPIPPIKSNLEGLTPSEIKENWDKLVDHFGLGVVEAPDAVLEAGLHGYYGDPFLVDSDNDGYLDRVATEEIFIRDAIEAAIEATPELIRREIWGDFTPETGGEQTPASTEIKPEAEEYFTPETGGEQTPASTEIKPEAEEYFTPETGGEQTPASTEINAEAEEYFTPETGGEQTPASVSQECVTPQDVGADIQTDLTDEDLRRLQQESSYNFQLSEQTSESSETYSQTSETANTESSNAYSSETSQYSGVTGYSDSSSSSSYG